MKEDSGKAAVLQYADEVMKALLGVFNCRSATVLEEAMLALVSGLACAHVSGWSGAGWGHVRVWEECAWEVGKASFEGDPNASTWGGCGGGGEGWLGHQGVG
jgi:hypothetical protein